MIEDEDTMQSTQHGCIEENIKHNEYTQTSRPCHPEERVIFIVIHNNTSKFSTWMYYTRNSGDSLINIRIKTINDIDEIELISQ